MEVDDDVLFVVRVYIWWYHTARISHYIRGNRSWNFTLWACANWVIEKPHDTDNISGIWSLVKWHLFKPDIFHMFATISENIKTSCILQPARRLPSRCHIFWRVGRGTTSLDFNCGGLGGLRCKDFGCSMRHQNTIPVEWQNIMKP